jgi:hypothetical protein
MHLPVECFPVDEGQEHAMRATTGDISPGGLYFEIDLANGARPPEVNALLGIELTVPPGEGHFPYQGRVSGVAEIIRCHRLDSDGAALPGAVPRYGVGARFHEPLKLAF